MLLLAVVARAGAAGRRHIVARRLFSSQSQPPAGAGRAFFGLASRLKEATVRYGRSAAVSLMLVSAADTSLAFTVIHTFLDAGEVLGKIEGLLVPLKRTLAASKPKIDDEQNEKAVEETHPREHGAQDIISSREKSITASLAVAFVVHKLLLPVRIPIALAITPRVAKIMRRFGLAS